MNREIKFRCWDKEDNKMLSHEDLKDINWSYSELTKKNDNYVLMQYTGLKNKNGVEIYEGDIVRGEEYNYDYLNYNHFYVGVVEYLGYLNIPKYEVMFDKKYSNIKCSFIGGTSLQSIDIEIIGNIYENKELLANEK